MEKNLRRDCIGHKGERPRRLSDEADVAPGKSEQQAVKRGSHGKNAEQKIRVA